MHDSRLPNPADLPAPAQLRRSSLLALIGAAAIAVGVVLPAEYGIDPTGAGSALGLTEMGEIKMQLAEEAEMDHQSSLLEEAFGLLVGKAHAEEAWRDEVSFTLVPGASAEWKMDMKKGQAAFYRMSVAGGRVNYDLHGHGGANSATYEKGRGSAGSEGGLIAAFDGAHGWFFRNRDEESVTVTLQIRGEHGALKEE
ncbi:transmembrane anchor protein [Rhodovulum sp. DZ06]|uniref:transmembrane anchor protein n=1 Tax=Rhodovulum sp. DZ06 TaxID=3425126 RepID=UPI003D34C633